MAAVDLVQQLAAVVDGAVIHRPEEHRVREITRAHDAIEVAHHHARIGTVFVDVLYGESDRREDHDRGRGGDPSRRPSRAPREKRRTRDERNPELVVAFEQNRRGESDQQRAERAAHRDHEIERREIPRPRPGAVELAVAHHAAHEESSREERRRLPQVERIDVPGHHRKEHGDERKKNRPGIPPRMIETQDERDEIERKRHDPQERDRSDVLCKVIRHGKQQTRTDR